MLTEAEKSQIQDAYRAWLKAHDYKPRYGQKLMIATAARELSKMRHHGPGDGPIAVVEAGTGTGKTIAYSLAAIPIARAQGKTLVITTATVALQEQIVFKDLPDVAKHSGLKFEYKLAKGRSRYLCTAKLDRILDGAGVQQASLDLGASPTQDTDQAAIELYSRMMDAFASGDWDGDKDGWPEEPEERVWRAVTTDHRQCTGRRCDFVRQCPFIEARKDLDKVDVVVANHDLVLADLSLGGGAVLPEPEESIYIFDEAHHLADKALNHFTHNSRMQGTRDWLTQVAQAAKAVAEGEAEPVGSVTDLALIPSLTRELDEQLVFTHHTLMDLSGFDDSEYPSDGEHFRFSKGEVPQQVRDQSEALNKAFIRLENRLDAVAMELEAIVDEASGERREAAEAWLGVMGGMHSRAAHNASLWRAFARKDPEGEAPWARWLTRRVSDYGEDLEVTAGPIMASEVLDTALWDRAAGVVMTSATLTALGRFDRLQQHTGIPERAVYERVPSPFDYSKAQLVIPPLDCEPSNDEAHTEAVADYLLDHVDYKSAALALFSSWRQLNGVRDLIMERVGERLLVQGELGKQEILNRHKERVDEGMGSLILGVASFAEGIDLPGDYLTHVIIAKIPFGVPDQPVDAAMSEWIEQQGRNPFMEISVPDASLRLVQGSGRLIRSEGDTGIISLLDKRILSRRYGQALLDGLPPYQRVFNAYADERG